MGDKKEKNRIKVCNVVDLLKENLSIPFYQRPYRWTAENHVKILLQDLFREKDKKEKKYRIGTVILHLHQTRKDEKKVLNIVDGQQRLVTLSLVLHALKIEGSYTSLLNEKFSHIDSKNNLKYNYNFILTYLSNKTEHEKTTLKDFILNGCEFLRIELNELSEAFQLFDSQNARGKELDPADLLKAYHLREMKGVYESEKHRIVNRWEETIEKKKLNDVLGNYLFRLRNWSRKEKKYFFSKNDVDEFKGVTPRTMIENGYQYPYLQRLSTSASSIYFAYNQPIVNGKWFFAYVSHYTDLVNRIEEICKKQGVISLNYSGAGRIGDRRLNKLYKNMLLVYLDKFGEDKSFEKYQKLLYRWVFITRLEQAQVRYQTILNKFDNKNQPIQWISSWLHPELDIMEMKLKSIQDVDTNSKRNDFTNENSIFKKLEAIENLKEISYE